MLPMTLALTIALSCFVADRAIARSDTEISATDAATDALIEAQLQGVSAIDAVVTTNQATDALINAQLEQLASVGPPTIIIAIEGVPLVDSLPAASLDDVWTDRLVMQENAKRLAINVGPGTECLKPLRSSGM